MIILSHYFLVLLNYTTIPIISLMFYYAPPYRDNAIYM